MDCRYSWFIISGVGFYISHWLFNSWRSMSMDGGNSIIYGSSSVFCGDWDLEYCRGVLMIGNLSWFVSCCVRSWVLNGVKAGWDSRICDWRCWYIWGSHIISGYIERWGQICFCLWICLVILFAVSTSTGFFLFTSIFATASRVFTAWVSEKILRNNKDHVLKCNIHGHKVKLCLNVFRTSTFSVGWGAWLLIL